MWYVKMYFSEKREFFSVTPLAYREYRPLIGSFHSWRACSPFWRWIVGN